MTTSCHALGVCQRRPDCADYLDCCRAQPCQGWGQDAAYIAARAIYGPYRPSPAQWLGNWAWRAAWLLVASAVAGLLAGYVAGVLP